jgi:hypothetical protein
VVQQPPATVVFDRDPLPPADQAEPQAYIPPPAPTEPPRELENLALVKRDGSVIAVVAFVPSGDKLMYITPAGVRRSVDLAEIDISATRKANETIGAMVVLPE